MPNPVFENGVAALAFARHVTLGLFKDMPDDKLCHQPIPECNHAIWIMGHIAQADNYFMTSLGNRPARCPEDWAQLFGMGSTPTPSPNDYPSLATLQEHLHLCREELISWFKSMSEDQLASPLPEELASFAKSHAALMGTLACHEALHAGQLTMIRKSLGIAPMVR